MSFVLELQEEEIQKIIWEEEEDQQIATDAALAELLERVESQHEVAENAPTEPILEVAGQPTIDLTKENNDLLRYLSLSS